MYAFIHYQVEQVIETLRKAAMQFARLHSSHRVGLDSIRNEVTSIFFNGPTGNKDDICTMLKFEETF